MSARIKPWFQFQFVSDKRSTPFWEMDRKHYLIFKIILAAFSFLLNGLFVIVLARNRHLVNKKRITYHVANLAVADALYGLGRFCYFMVLLYPNELAIMKSLPLFESMCAGFYLASETAVLLMTIERSIVVAKPLTWTAILPRERMLLFIICSWIAVTLLAMLYYFFWKVDYSGVAVVMFILYPVFLLFTAVVNIYMFKKLREKDGLAHSHRSTQVVPQANAQHKSTQLKNKASILVLWLTFIMIVTCFPNSLKRVIIALCLVYKLHCNSLNYLRVINIVFAIVEDLNFLVNPLVYIWKDRVYRNAFYRTFKIKHSF